MKKISTKQGFFILVDDSDYEYLRQFTWKARKDRNTYYAVRRYSVRGRVVEETMHRLIMGTPDHLQVDHRDRNGLNNQRENLRNVRASVNCHNVAARSNTGYLGVSRRSWGKADGSVTVRFTASIGCEGEKYSLGNHATAEGAAEAYNKKAMELYGLNATLNELG